MPLNAHSDSLQAPPEGPRQPTSSPVLALPLTLHSTALPSSRCLCAGSSRLYAAAYRVGEVPTGISVASTQACATTCDSALLLAVVS